MKRDLPASITNPSGHKNTMPWDDDEYMTVNGWKVVYSIDQNGTTVVHLHGGATLPLSSLLHDPNRAVVLPVKWRDPIDRSRSNNHA